MLLALLSIAAGLVLLYGGAEGLVRGASALALRMGLTPLVVGLTVVAFGTSAPELVVSLQAVLAGRDAIALGNVVGSNVANIAFILGLAAVLQPMRVHGQLLRLDVPMMLGSASLLVVMLLDGHLARFEGGVLFAMLV
ncbi:MAG: sodium:calcium antiporter, partial [Rhodothermales bacterium]|nr:sodium:calcium antiporter [Rhodothermales bacterium]